MDDKIFLSPNDIYTYYKLNEGYMGGMLNEDASIAFERLADRLDTIETTCSNLFKKGDERSQEEETLYQKCFKNLVEETSFGLWSYDDHTLIGEFERVSQEPNLDSNQTILKESLTSVIKRKGLELPQVGRSI